MGIVQKSNSIFFFYIFWAKMCPDFLYTVFLPKKDIVGLFQNSTLGLHSPRRGAVAQGIGRKSVLRICFWSLLRKLHTWIHVAALRTPHFAQGIGGI
jgi:hypothetical protein